MKRAKTQTRRSRLTKSSHRAGVIMVWTLWIMLAACFIAGSLMNVVYVSGIRSEAQNCASSSALAAGHGYLTDDLLRLHQEAFEVDGRATRCRQQALRISEEHRRASRIPMLTEDDIELLVPELTGPTSDACAYVPTEVKVAFKGRGRHGLPLFFAGLTGLDRVNLGVQACVKIEHSPIAFRPGRSLSVPILPFAICDEMISGDAETDSLSSDASDDEPTSEFSGYWTSNIESGRGRDEFGWNSETHRFENGPDGLPELTVTIYSTSSAGHEDAFIPMPFGPNGSLGTGAYAVWIQNGLTIEELEGSGESEIRYPGSMNVGIIAPTDLAACRSSLESKIGEPCIISLCSLSPSNSESSVMTLKRPVSARVVQVTTAAAGSLKVVLQPCVMITSTAVTAPSPSAGLNRYIYSVRLCE
ncbi:MAG: hypothetical protein ACK58L_04650 [Planctomycetota bacterium]